MRNSYMPRVLPAESEFIARTELQKKSHLAAKFKKESEESERLLLKQTHWMHCPNCGLTLHEAKYKGMPIVKCTDCHGIFIDEKILAAFAGEDIPEEQDNVVMNLFNLFRV